MIAQLVERETVNFVVLGSNPSHPELWVWGMLEKDIKRQIIQWLRWKGIFCWVQSSVGIWDAKDGKYRKMNGAGQMRGVADILGIFKGRPLAIEVKAKRGVLSEHQAYFLAQFAEAGGIAIVARSVEDVEVALHIPEQ